MIACSPVSGSSNRNRSCFLPLDSAATRYAIPASSPRASSVYGRSSPTVSALPFRGSNSTSSTSGSGQSSGMSGLGSEGVDSGWYDSRVPVSASSSEYAWFSASCLSSDSWPLPAPSAPQVGRRRRGPGGPDPFRRAGAERLRPRNGRCLVSRSRDAPGVMSHFRKNSRRQGPAPTAG